MEQCQKTALRKCRVELVKNLRMDVMFPHIASHWLLTPLMLEHIKAKSARADQVRMFLDMLLRRGPSAFNTLLQILRDTNQNTAANSLAVECMSHGGSGISQLSLTTSTPSRPSRTVLYSRHSGVQETQPPAGNSQHNEDSQMDVSTSDPASSRSYATRSHTATANGYHGNIGYTGNLEEEYKMASTPRGYLLIINNKNFRAPLPNREGTDVDRNKLERLFLDLGFGVEIRNNLTELEIRHNLCALSKHHRLSHVDCLVVAILTHGSEESIYGVDGKCLNVYEAYKFFTAENCPALHNKPKFFIMNACRGDQEDQGCMTTMTPSLGNVERDIHVVPAGRDLRTRIPNMKDFLVAYSTIPGHVSWRHLHEGTFFVQGFVKVFGEMANRMDVVKMLVKVNDEVSKQVNHAGVQIPGPQVMLTKTWYLNPPRQR